MNYYSYPCSCTSPSAFSRRSLFVARVLHPSIERSWFLLNLRRHVARTTMDNNNTWFKVQNMSLVSSRENRTHAGWRASTDKPQLGNKQLAGFRCGELAKVAPMYKKVSRKRRQAAEAIRNESIKREREHVREEMRSLFQNPEICFPLSSFLSNS